MIYKNFSIENKTVIITGGTGHIGSSISKTLIECKAKTYVISRNIELLNELSNFASDNKLNDFLVICEEDILKVKKVDKLIDHIISKEGKIDGLINNAYDNNPLKRKPLNDLMIEEVNNDIGKSVSSDLFISRKVKHGMDSSKGGSIIFTSSLFGFVSPNYKMYLDLGNQPSILTSIDKSAIIQMAKVLAAEWGKENIRVNCVSPGFFPRKRGKERPDYMNEVTSRIPMDRIGTPEELAGAYIYLLSDSSRYLTGQNIVVDGGYSLW